MGDSEKLKKNCLKFGTKGKCKQQHTVTFPFSHRKLLEHRNRLLSGKMSPGKASPNASDFQLDRSKSKPLDAAQEPPAQPRRPAPTLAPEKDKNEKKKESTKRRPAPAAPVSTVKQITEAKGKYKQSESFDRCKN